MSPPGKTFQVAFQFLSQAAEIGWRIHVIPAGKQKELISGQFTQGFLQDDVSAPTHTFKKLLSGLRKRQQGVTPIFHRTDNHRKPGQLFQRFLDMRQRQRGTIDSQKNHSIRTSGNHIIGIPHPLTQVVTLLMMHLNRFREVMLLDKEFPFNLGAVREKEISRIAERSGPIQRVQQQCLMKLKATLWSQKGLQSCLDCS